MDIAVSGYSLPFKGLWISYDIWRDNEMEEKAMKELWSSAEKSLHKLTAGGLRHFSRSNWDVLNKKPAVFTDCYSLRKAFISCLLVWHNLLLISAYTTLKRLLGIKPTSNYIITLWLLCFHLSIKATFQIYSPTSMCFHRHTTNQMSPDALVHRCAVSYRCNEL